MSKSAVLLVSCPDRPGLVASITDFIFRRKGNILHLDQHVDSEQDVFFMRVAWDLAHFETPPERIAAAFAPIAEQYNMDWRLHFSDERLRMAIFVSKQDHCLYDILSRWQSGELPVEIPLIISNHPDLAPVADKFGLPFEVYQINAENKAERERQQIERLHTHKIDFVVLARYMQILTGDFISHFPDRIINIHHSFLPAFPGARPYHQAYQRGVKIIGATSHYVTQDLDAGPIIEQNVARVDHRDSVKDMIRKGKDLEKTVLASAIWYHINHRVLAYNNKTVVFQ
ncbi:MAG: formyltetrahydrofolate deformylase [Anaerolineaceae bacterium]|nr:MAG: formyltetrahydrofolate deformylase [Anaerolineaceae bacterium]